MQSKYDSNLHYRGGKKIAQPLGASQLIEFKSKQYNKVDTE